MEPPFSGETETSHGEASTPPSVSSQLALTPHYIIAPEEIVADRYSPLGVGRRNHGGVFKGFWNNSLVGIRLLSNDTPVDVSGQRSQLESLSTHRGRRIPDVVRTHPGLAGLEASTCVTGLWYLPNRCRSALHRLAILSEW
jgi:hypothetical protein